MMETDPHLWPVQRDEEQSESRLIPYEAMSDASDLPKPRAPFGRDDRVVLKPRPRRVAEARVL